MLKNIKLFFRKFFIKAKSFFIKDNNINQNLITENNNSVEITDCPVILSNEINSLDNDSKSLLKWKTKNYKIKKPKHRFKDVDLNNFREIEEIEATAENSCDRKLRKTQINNLKVWNGVIKSKQVVKLSLSTKRYSLYRHKLKVKKQKFENFINRVNNNCLENYVNRLNYQNNVNQTKTEEKTSSVSDKTCAEKNF